VFSKAEDNLESHRITQVASNFFKAVIDTQTFNTMPVPSAINNFLVWRERQQARQGHERVETEETNARPLQSEQEQRREEQLAQQSSSRPPEAVSLADSVSEEEEEGDVENQRTRPLETDAPSTTQSTQRTSSRRTLSLADLEEERELARRRTSGCVLIAAFILFRLWIEAVTTGDFGLLLLCMVGTSWTARFIRHNREREEQLDRLIIQYNENGENGEISRSDVRILSFQAQLALAIIESQRQMVQGGYGNPDGPEATPGVSDDAKEHWDTFEFKTNLGLPGQSSKHWSDNSPEEEPHCSICLCEYEAEEKLVCLPCKHVYHHDCLSSWCSNHTRCPLCNFDLESVTSEASD
jgi:hypothetical protein